MAAPGHLLRAVVVGVDGVMDLICFVAMGGKDWSSIDAEVQRLRGEAALLAQREQELEARIARLAKP